MKNLLIGAIDLYAWKDIAPWVKSFRKYNAIDDVILICYRINSDIVEECKQYNVQLLQAAFDDMTQEIVYERNGLNTVVHQLRFFHMWQYLQTINIHTYNFIISTDVRDVVFQDDPFVFLTDLEEKRDKYNDSWLLLASSEGIKYKDEGWGLDNITKGYGSIVAEYYKNKVIHNVGVVAGFAEHCRALFLTLYSMSKGRYIPNDQSSYNILVHETMIPMFMNLSNDKPWACQCGTMLDPSKEYYKPFLVDYIPIIRDGIVYTSNEQKFHIVHQWDRVPELKQYVEGLYL